jgi:tetratricopeptide (TPR) repeat protein
VDGCLAPEVVDGLVAGKLDDAAAARAEAHIDTCSRCRVLVAQLAKSAVTAVERPSAPASRETPHLIDRYRIERRLGAGGMGVVYLAHDPELDRKVVIKLLRAEVATLADRARLMREAQAMAKVSHTNVVPIYDIGVHDDQIFLAMELVDGQDVAAWLAEPRDVRAVLDVFVAAGRGLAAAHRAGLVHRDFKPHNVMLATSGEVKVTDFGLARAETAAVETVAPIRAQSLLESPLTHTGAMVGTPAYMAPEQILMRAVDARADQFSYCVALYEGLYGERPFHGKTVEELFESTLDGKPKLERRGVPARVRAALRRGLSVEPDERFPTMDALLAEIAPRARTHLVLAGIAVLALAAGGVAFALTRDAKLCTGADAELAKVWNPARARALEAQLAVRDPTLGPIRAHSLDVMLERYANAWIATHRDACEDTRVRGDQTDAAMERRMTCLRQRRDELAAALDVIATDKQLPDVAAVIGGLAAPSVCDNAAALDEPIADPKLRAQVDGVRRDFARVAALAAASRNDEARAALKPLLERAEALRYAPLLAELYVEQGELANAGLDWKLAQTWLDRAVEAAEKAGSDRLRGRAFVAHVETATMTGAPEEAERFGRFGRGLLERIDDQPQLAQLDRMLAWNERERGHADEAARLYEHAIERMTAIDPQSRAIAVIEKEYGLYFNKRGDYEAAYRMIDKARETYAAAGGENDPGVAETYSLLAQVRANQGRPAEALALGTKARDAMTAYYGAKHRYVLAVNTMYAPWLDAAGKHDEAAALMRENVAMTAELFGKTHPQYAGVLGSLGRFEFQRKNYGEAAEAFDNARAAYVAYYGKEEHADVVLMLNAIAQARIRQEHFDEALPLLAHARELVAKLGQRDGPLDAEVLTYVGIAHARAGRTAQGIAALEQSLALELANKTGPADSAYTKVELAKAYLAKGDKQRAMTIAKEARAEAEAGGDATRRDAADALLRGEHPPR